MGKIIYRKMRIATWSLQNPPIQKSVLYPPQITRIILSKNCKKL